MGARVCICGGSHYTTLSMSKSILLMLNCTYQIRSRRRRRRIDKTSYILGNRPNETFTRFTSVCILCEYTFFFVQKDI